MGCKISLCEQQIQLGRSVDPLMSENASDELPVKLSQHDCNGKTITQIESDLQGWSLNQLTFINQSKQASLASLCLTRWVPMVTWWSIYYEVTAVFEQNLSNWTCRHDEVILDKVMHLFVSKDIFVNHQIEYKIFRELYGSWMIFSTNIHLLDVVVSS